MFRMWHFSAELGARLIFPYSGLNLNIIFYIILLNHFFRLEDNLLGSDITVKNGSLSHAQLLDTLPSLASKKDNKLALKILKSSLLVFNSECLPNNIDGNKCRSYLEQKPLPEGSSLRTECENSLKGNREGHYAFRRLLGSSHYRNGFYQVRSAQKNRM